MSLVVEQRLIVGLGGPGVAVTVVSGKAGSAFTGFAVGVMGVMGVATEWGIMFGVDCDTLVLVTSES